MSEVEEYRMRLKHEPTTVLDIGANIGAFSIRARAWWPNAKIIAYEPSPRSAQQFLANVTDENTSLINTAIRKEAGDSLMWRGDSKLQRDNTGVADSFYDLGYQTAETFFAQCIRADSLPTAEFVKVDTEGCEVEIIEGLNLSKTQALVCEYHRKHDAQRIIDVAEAQGLKLVSRTEDDENTGLLKFARDGALAAPKATREHLPHAKPHLDHIKLFIGLPVYQKVDVYFMQCLLALQVQKPCEIEIHITQGDGIARARNELTAKFLRSDCTHLLFIDCDLIFDAEQIACLLERDLPVVGGFYSKKQQGKLEWVINTLQPNPPRQENELQEVRYAGTGFLCIKREVFEAMAKAHPESVYREDYGARGIAHEFWPMTNYGPGSAMGRLERARVLLGVWKSSHGMGMAIEPMEKILNGVSEQESRYLSEDWYFPVDPSTEVLCSDWSWKPIGEINVGDKMMSLDENSPPNSSRRFLVSDVTRVIDRQLPKWRIVHEDGEIVTTAEHPWLSKRSWRRTVGFHKDTQKLSPPHKWTWTRTDHLKAGDFLSSVVPHTTNPSIKHPDYLAGYIQGIFHSDGTFSDRYRQAAVCMKDMGPLKRLESAFETHGIEYKLGKDYHDGNPNHSTMHKIGIYRKLSLQKLKEIINRNDDGHCFSMGYLAGMYDGDGSHSGGVASIYNLKAWKRSRCIEFGLKAGIVFKERADGRGVRITDGDQIRKFWMSVLPANDRRIIPIGQPGNDGVVRMAETFNRPVKIVSVQPIEETGHMRCISTTSGTFIANGFASHNCQRWLDLGGRVFMDCRVVLKHIGTVIFPLQSQESEIDEPNGAGAVAETAK